MDERTIKTIQWKSENLSLFKKNAQICKLGSTRSNKPDDFVKFFASYANASLQSMLDWADKTQKSIDCSDPDVTHITTFSENSCLHSTNSDAPSALEIILCHLKGLGHGKRVPALCCFLDEDMNAVVQFVKRDGGYYAELYCLSSENSSALHLVEYKGKKYIIPVVFATTTDFESFWAKANALGGYCILSRDKGEELSKGTIRANTSFETGRRRYSDDGDFL